MLRRILTILAIVACVGVAVLSQTKLREHIEGIIQQREKNAQDRDRERARAQKAETNLRTTSNTLVSTTATLASTRNELASTKASLDTATAARDKAQQDLEKAKESEKTALQNLAKWDALNLKPEQVKALQEDLGKSKQNVAALEEETQMLVRKVARLTNELNKYIDPQNYVVQLPVGLEGKILTVDPKWDFVVLDIGEKQGVLKDGIMLVHRGSKFIGKVRITNVLANRSIANIMPGWELEDIHEGDKVLF